MTRANPAAVLLAMAACVCALSPAIAQGDPAKPYAGRQTQEIKSLTASEIDDLRNGRGMGFAMPAELNGYPGPAHILELSGQLQLTQEQKARVQQLFERMKSETSKLGEQLIADERALDDAFANKTINAASLDALTARAGATRAKLRAAHLRYHLEAAPLLDEKQTRLYARLRGYGGPNGQDGHGGKSGHGGAAGHGANSGHGGHSRHGH